MAPKRGFSDEAVADAVMQVFWTHGYRATSIDDLATATGVRKGSLHNAFGNKEDLFVIAIERYAKDFSNRMADKADDADPLVAVPAFFRAVTSRMTEAHTPPGCLTSAACSEFGELPPRAKNAVREVVEQTRARLAKFASAAVNSGLLPATTDPKAQADLWFAITRGMAALHKVTGDTDAVERIAETVIAQLSGRATAP
ncbi:TetR/AcrR family transcriptional regulator [Roseobacter sp. YSTF-M11]|uniref:TetR/AcrR family transcriptional regulator n=1 Tax=Roseobacter insulae TaxID=2859783 RepID=A0A9X1FZC4_9RHOB|nr:TetR/AcrR family transcriptional regulator [Roseobacter insulae]MBW4709825.1 TetR/AcrR family transcriptional regulator [Roseobacter insulae]